MDPHVISQHTVITMPQCQHDSRLCQVLKPEEEIWTNAKRSTMCLKLERITLCV